MDGLEHGGVLAGGIQVGGGGDTDGTGEGGSEIGKNVGVLKTELA